MDDPEPFDNEDCGLLGAKGEYSEEIVAADDAEGGGCISLGNTLSTNRSSSSSESSSTSSSSSSRSSISSFSASLLLAMRDMTTS